jgi:hypothetical protein
MAKTTDLEDLWRHKTNAQLVDAFLWLAEYSAEGQRVIRAELARRHLAEPAPKMLSFHQVETVARLQRRFVGLVAAEWLSLIVGIAVNALFPGGIGSTAAFVGVCVFIGARVALPFTGYKLLTCLEIESPRGTAILMQMPLFSLLVLMGLRSLTDRWSRMHGIEVGILGPTRGSLARLHQAKSG